MRAVIIAATSGAPITAGASRVSPKRANLSGSVRPDALFLAWGPGGVTSARLGEGLLGLLLDARYGILPYVPLLVLAVAGFVLGGLLAVMLIKVMSVALTAVTGAFLSAWEATLEMAREALP